MAGGLAAALGGAFRVNKARASHRRHSSELIDRGARGLVRVRRRLEDRDFVAVANPQPHRSREGEVTKDMRATADEAAPQAGADVHDTGARRDDRPPDLRTFNPRAGSHGRTGTKVCVGHLRALADHDRTDDHARRDGGSPVDLNPAFNLGLLVARVACDSRRPGARRTRQPGRNRYSARHPPLRIARVRQMLPRATQPRRSRPPARPSESSRAPPPRSSISLRYELRREVPSAIAAARQATVDEPDNWSTWTVLSRLEAERGHARAAIAHFRRARALNPASPPFTVRRATATSAP